jgi:hypothetical protein
MDKSDYLSEPVGKWYDWQAWIGVGLARARVGMWHRPFAGVAGCDTRKPIQPDRAGPRDALAEQVGPGREPSVAWEGRSDQRAQCHSALPAGVSGLKLGGHW